MMRQWNVGTLVFVIDAGGYCDKQCTEDDLDIMLPDGSIGHTRIFYVV